MNRIEVELGRRSYPILIGPGLMIEPGLLADQVSSRQVLIVSNEVVAPLYLERVEVAFADHERRSLILPDGEETKTLANFARIIDELIGAGFHRDATIVALGGGVIGDLAGFAAACYQRGIDFLQLPTTLLAQVDSSVGGKTAVNHPDAKNMIGAFHQPVAVVTDTDTLRTLPRRELAAGLAEVIKYGVIEDAAFFTWLENHLAELLALEAGALSHAISRCCEIKAAIVAEDEQERGRRALLNLGHTFGHALEAVGGYGKWLHGEAVAIGMQMAAEASVSLGWLTPVDSERIRRLLEQAGLPTTATGTTPAELMGRMRLDKKAGSGGLRFILPRQIGEAVIVDAPDEDVIRAAIAGSLATAS